jgi:hypothetical protein
MLWKNHIWDVEDLKKNMAAHQAQKGKLNHHQATAGRSWPGNKIHWYILRLQELGRESSV